MLALLLVLQMTEAKSAQREGGDSAKEAEDRNRAQSLRETFYERHCSYLAPILIKSLVKLLNYAHAYVVSPSNQLAITSAVPLTVLNGLLAFSGGSLLHPKDKKSHFCNHLPSEVLDRLKSWSAALPIDASHKEDLSTKSAEEFNLSNHMLKFLDLHYTAFAGTRTYDPTRSLKSTVSSVLFLLHRMLQLKPSEGKEVVLQLVPVACDVMADFAHSELRKLVKIGDEAAFSLASRQFKLSHCFDLVRLPSMRSCNLLGPVLTDLFDLLSTMLDNPDDWPVLSLLSDPSSSTSELHGTYINTGFEPRVQCAWIKNVCMYVRHNVIFNNVTYVQTHTVTYIVYIL